MGRGAKRAGTTREKYLNLCKSEDGVETAVKSYKLVDLKEDDDNIRISSFPDEKILKLHIKCGGKEYHAEAEMTRGWVTSQVSFTGKIRNKSRYLPFAGKYLTEVGKSLEDSEKICIRLTRNNLTKSKQTIVSCKGNGKISEVRWLRRDHRKNVRS